MIQYDLIPTKKLDEINSALDFHFGHVESINQTLVIQVADLCEESEWKDGAIGIYDYWVVKEDMCEVR